ncbi:MAG: PIN domain-containing protein [Candidatus Bipolaricaulis sp.]|nr:PIN domain-containing protein [Candidatus Bipolaricaulis sp.]
MKDPDGVLLDTSAWIAFFSPKGHRLLKSEAQDALDAERVHTCSVVVCELLVGARDRPTFAKLDKLLNALPDVSIDQGVWKRAADLGFSLRTRGRSVPLSDLLIAEACRLHSLELWQLDAHYEVIRDQAPFSMRSFLEA